MSATRKAEIMEKVQASRSPIRQTLRQLDVPKSTYYRWRTGTRAPDRRTRTIPWNRLTEGEWQTVLTVARASPEWSSRQLAAWNTDNEVFSVSESSVFRILSGAYDRFHRLNHSQSGSNGSPPVELSRALLHTQREVGTHRMATPATGVMTTRTACHRRWSTPHAKTGLCWLEELPPVQRLLCR